MSEFRGKRVLITGAAGIHGRWFAAAFARAGARLLLSDNRAEAWTRLSPTSASIPAATLTHVTELLDDASIADLAAATAREWGAPDIVLNNAGIYPGKPLLETEARTTTRCSASTVARPSSSPAMRRG
jgi:3-oxoacyl-[acyl-carrier protein] reductase